MLSIVIPHYNSVQSLKKLLNSIPIQDDIEIIVVDDQTDKELELLNMLTEDNQYNHVTFLKNNTNDKGAGTCRNIGITKANGEWVFFADADDFFTEEFYSTVKKYFTTDNDVVFFTPTSIELETGNASDRHIIYKKYIVDYFAKKDLQSELSLRYKFHVPWSKLIKLSFLRDNNINFDEVIASNDVMFSTLVGYHMNKFDISKEVVYCVTKNKGSLTVNISKSVFDARLLVHINYSQFLKARLSPRELKLLQIKGGMGYLISTLKYRFGAKEFFKTYFTLKKAKIRIFDVKYLNPRYLLRGFMYYYKVSKRDQKYYVKN